MVWICWYICYSRKCVFKPHKGHVITYWTQCSEHWPLLQCSVRARFLLNPFRFETRCAIKEAIPESTPIGSRHQESSVLYKHWAGNHESFGSNPGTGRRGPLLWVWAAPTYPSPCSSNTSTFPSTGLIMWNDWSEGTLPFPHKRQHQFRYAWIVYK